MSRQRLHLRIPGSTANLGPGFDSLGLALELYTDISFELLPEADDTVPLIQCKGDIAQQLPIDQSNLIFATMASLWQGRAELLSRLRLKISTEIPLSRGLGSSSTAVLGAVWAAQVLSGGGLDKSSILQQASAIEGHADNLAASLFGGMVVCQGAGSEVLMQPMSWPAEWGTVAVVPPYALSTEKSRAVLPSSVAFTDAVGNLQKVAVLLAAVANKDDRAFMRALADKLHEPYRESLVPELMDLRLKLRALPALGCVLSGAGPSILVIVKQEHKPEVCEFLRSWAQTQKPGTQVLDLNVDQHGVRELPGD